LSRLANIAHLWKISTPRRVDSHGVIEDGSTERTLTLSKNSRYRSEISASTIATESNLQNTIENLIVRLHIRVNVTRSTNGACETHRESMVMLRFVLSFLSEKPSALPINAMRSAFT